MTTKEFKQKWESQGDELNRFPSDCLFQFNFRKETIDFLTTIGLPFQAAPNLDFVIDCSDEYNRLDRISKIYDLDSSFDKFIVIGSDGNGNPIVINTSKNDSIELLDHESEFSLLEFINDSAITFAFCLLFYRDFVLEVISENGDDAFMNRNFTDHQFNKLKNNLATVGINSENNGFWKIELENLLTEREFYKQNPKNNCC